MLGRGSGAFSWQGASLSVPIHGCRSTACVTSGASEKVSDRGVIEPIQAKVHSGFHTTVRADSSATPSVRLYLLAAPASCKLTCWAGRKAQSCIQFANARLQLHCV